MPADRVPDAAPAQGFFVQYCCQKYPACEQIVEREFLGEGVPIESPKCPDHPRLTMLVGGWRKPDLLVAAPDHAEALATLRAHTPSLSFVRSRREFLFALAEIEFALVERQQDKERIERLTEIEKAAGRLADLYGREESCRNPLHAPRQSEWVNAWFALRMALSAAALAVEKERK